MKRNKILLSISLFIGINAIIGSFMMFIDKTGNLLKMNDLLIYFKVLPLNNILFNDYIFPGICLLIVNGISNIIAIVMLIKKNNYNLEINSGILLMLWTTIQFVILPFNMLSFSFFILGLIQVILSYICKVRYMQSLFTINYNKYKNINKIKDKVVVYFSRSNYTKCQAYEIANKLEYSLLEIKTKEKINGTLGFWWCGRFGMHKWPMSLVDNYDLSKYKEVIICSPVWVFDVSSPIKELLILNKNKIKNVTYVLTHFMNNSFTFVADNMDKLLNIKRKKLISYTIRFGIIKNKYEEE